jgi:hypothetical protein
MKKYEIMLVMENVAITDVEAIINLVDQGWEHHSNNKYHSLTVTLCKFVEVETYDFTVNSYIEAINAVGGNIKAANWYKEI